MPVSRKAQPSLDSVIPELLGGQDGMQEFQKVLRQKTVVRSLLSARLAARLTQANLAVRMGVTQSCISKIENGFDDDLTLGQLHAYLSALGTDFQIMTYPEGMKAAQSVRFHIHHANEAMKQVVALAHRDDKIAAGAGDFIFQVFNSFNQLLMENSKLLPKSSQGVPYVEIQQESTPDLETQTLESQAKSKPTRVRRAQHSLKK